MGEGRPEFAEKMKTDAETPEVVKKIQGSQPRELDCKKWSTKGRGVLEGERATEIVSLSIEGDSYGGIPYYYRFVRWRYGFE